MDLFIQGSYLNKSTITAINQVSIVKCKTFIGHKEAGVLNTHMIAEHDDLSSYKS